MTRSSRPAAAFSLLVTVSLIGGLSHGIARAEDGVPVSASLTGSGEDGRSLPMPLRHTEVRVAISGFVARVEVVQTFGNPFDAPLEANYLLPLPERAAVDDC